MKSWKTPVIAFIVAVVFFAGIGGWLYTRQANMPAGSVQLEGVPQFEGGGLLFTGRNQTETLPTEEEVINTQLSESTEIGEIEQDLNNTVILDEDFSDL